MESGEMEENYVGYLIGALEDDERRAVEAHVASHPAEGLRLNRMRRALEPLDRDRIDYEPPVDLAMRTVSLVAEHIVNTEERVTDESVSPVADFLKSLSQHPLSPAMAPIYPWHGGDEYPPAPRRRNLAAAFGLTAALLMVGGVAILTMRQTAEAQACQSNLRNLHQGVSTYCDSQPDGSFPRVATHEDVRGALAKMQKACSLPNNSFSCPGAKHPPTGLPDADYAYQLGYRNEGGELVGLNNRDDDKDQFPLFADAPERHGTTVTPVNHRKGQNVLFAGGNVRFCTSPAAGPINNGKADNIYFNEDGEAKAGKHRRDSVLGSPDNRP